MTTDLADALDQARTRMAERGIDALLLGPGADLQYLVGYHAPEMERLTLLVARADGEDTLLVPALERLRAEAAPLPDGLRLHSIGETDDPFRAVAGALGNAGGQPLLGAGDHLWSMFLLGLQEALPGARWTLASTVMRELRMRKRPEEVDALRRAAQAIDRVHARVPSMLAPGRTEADVGRDIADAIVEEGHEAVSFVIVGSGPNSASCHHETGERRIEAGDALVVDIGGTIGGYGSDCTRNYVVGEPPEGYAEAHAALERAQAAACEAVRPGVRAEEVDAAARAVLREAGYAEYFIHRTGHGIGLETHEDPYIVEGNDLPLEAGMTFSIEPGVYIPGRYGMRIEDIVAVTGAGVERLNRLDRAVVTVP